MRETCYIFINILSSEKLNLFIQRQDRGHTKQTGVQNGDFI